MNGQKEAISISIKSFALGLSGKLKSGDIIKIISSDYGEMRQTLIPPELQYVEVLAVTTDKGDDESVQANNTPDDEEKQLPSTVTLLADNTQAKILADLEAKGKIHIALVYRGEMLAQTNHRLKRPVKNNDFILALNLFRGFCGDRRQ